MILVALGLLFIIMMLQCIFANKVFGIVSSPDEEAFLMMAMLFPIVGFLFSCVKTIFNKIENGRYFR